MIMKFTFLLALTISTFSIAQDDKPSESNSKKGSFYIYWGWNRAKYSNSDISFKGNNYDFTLYDVEAKDRQSKFDLGLYLNPGTITIPQYNFRIGYYLNDKYDLSIGADHMKYVMVNDQASTIDGTITNSGTTYDGTYSKQPFAIDSKFLKFEHTDGLNYINAEIRRHQDLFKIKKHIQVSILGGLGGGVLVPRTNTTLLNNPRYDQFHLAGFGLGAMFGVNFELLNHFFIQTELKAGYINMPSIRTTMFKTDNAKQSFNFLQTNVVFGYRFFAKKCDKKCIKK